MAMGTTYDESAGRADNDATRANPWKTFAGIWRDNPDFDAFCDEIKRLRREADQVDAGS